MPLSRLYQRQHSTIPTKRKQQVVAGYFVEAIQYSIAAACCQRRRPVDGDCTPDAAFGLIGRVGAFVDSFIEPTVMIAAEAHVGVERALPRPKKYHWLILKIWRGEHRGKKTHKLFAARSQVLRSRHFPIAVSLQRLQQGLA